jgi:hypothetical protein
MKKIFWMAFILIGLAAARECQAQPALAVYTCTLERPSGTLTNVQLHLQPYNTCLIFGPPGIPPQQGIWDEKRLVRTFWIMNSSNQYVGTIRRGVVRGNFLNYRTGDTGTLEANP